jgi:hypothetical protein
MLFKVKKIKPTFGQRRTVQKFALFPVRVIVATKSAPDSEAPIDHYVWLERYNQTQWYGSDCWYSDYNFIVRG